MNAERLTPEAVRNVFARSVYLMDREPGWEEVLAIRKARYQQIKEIQKRESHRPAGHASGHYTEEVESDAVSK